MTPRLLPIGWWPAWVMDRDFPRSHREDPAGGRSARRLGRCRLGQGRAIAKALVDGRLQCGCLIGRDFRLSHDADADAIPCDALGREAHPDDERSPFDEVIGDAAALAFPPAARVVAVRAIVAHDPDPPALHLVMPLIIATEM